jgi:hypothetical protein
MVSSQRTPSFIDQIAEGPVEAQKLRELGAESPGHLLGQIYAAPEAFDRYVGPERAKVLVQKLRQLVPPDSPSLRDPPIAPPGPLGVPLTPPPVDIKRRDALYQRIQDLKARGAPQGEIRATEDELDRLLRSGQ